MPLCQDSVNSKTYQVQGIPYKITYNE